MASQFHTVRFQAVLQRVSAWSHIWEKCFCRDTWNVMYDVLLLLVCALYRMLFGSVAFTVIRQTSLLCSMSFSSRYGVFICQ